MLQRKSSAGRWRRAVIGVVVAAVATVASARLFIDGSNPDARDEAALRDADVAGHIGVQFVEGPRIISPAPDPITLSATIDRSASIAAYFQDAGLDQAAAQRWAWFLQQSADIRNFQRGHALTLYKDPETGELRGVRYNLDDRVAVSALTYGDGVIRSSQELIRYVVRPVAVSFRLRNNFWREAERNGLPRPIAATLDYAFRDRHPLGELPRGSDIKLIYQEKVSRDGTAHVVTGLQAAQISFAGKTLTAFAFRDESGQPRLYDADGEALGPESLRFPVNFQYISSGFTFRRYHPILHEYRPHVGVDLAAHYGTPVKAVADGRVEVAGWCGELGRCIRIQHEGGIVSIYGHLSAITPGLESGNTVHIGDVIGRVGSSGLSTGPHLHYALEEDGRYVNPLTHSLGIHHTVAPRMRALFDRFKSDYMEALERLPDFGGRFTGLRVIPAVSAPVTNESATAGPALTRTLARPAHHRPQVEKTAATSMIDGRSTVMR
jgi:predicted secreted protein